MFGSQDLKLVQQMQAELRREADRARQAKQHRTMEHHANADARRVFGLRLSLA
jgi:hypothetical protein